MLAAQIAALFARHTASAARPTASRTAAVFQHPAIEGQSRRAQAPSWVALSAGVSSRQPAPPRQWRATGPRTRSRGFPKASRRVGRPDCQRCRSPRWQIQEPPRRSATGTIQSRGSTVDGRHHRTIARIRERGLLLPRHSSSGGTDTRRLCCRLDPGVQPRYIPRAPVPGVGEAVDDDVGGRPYQDRQEQSHDLPGRPPRNAPSFESSARLGEPPR
jgi:hypothetical protein